MYCFTYCLVDIVLVIGSVVHVDKGTNGDKHGYYRSSRSAVHLMVHAGATAVSLFGSERESSFRG